MVAAKKVNQLISTSRVASYPFQEEESEACAHESIFSFENLFP